MKKTIFLLLLCLLFVLSAACNALAVNESVTTEKAEPTEQTTEKAEVPDTITFETKEFGVFHADEIFGPRDGRTVTLCDSSENKSLFHVFYNSGTKNESTAVSDEKLFLLDNRNGEVIDQYEIAENTVCPSASIGNDCIFVLIAENGNVYKLISVKEGTASSLYEFTIGASDCSPDLALCGDGNIVVALPVTADGSAALIFISPDGKVLSEKRINAGKAEITSSAAEKTASGFYWFLGKEEGGILVSVFGAANDVSEYEFSFDRLLGHMGEYLVFSEDEKNNKGEIVSMRIFAEDMNGHHLISKKISGADVFSDILFAGNDLFVVKNVNGSRSRILMFGERPILTEFENEALLSKIEFMLQPDVPVIYDEGTEKYRQLFFEAPQITDSTPEPCDVLTKGDFVKKDGIAFDIDGDGEYENISMFVAEKASGCYFTLNIDTVKDNRNICNNLYFTENEIVSFDKTGQTLRIKSTENGEPVLLEVVFSDYYIEIQDGDGSLLPNYGYVGDNYEK